MKEILVNKNDSGQRIDKYIKKYLNDAPLNFIYKLFRKKDIKVNGHWVKQDYILKSEDVIKIYVTDSQLNEFKKPNKIENIKIDIKIVYEDENIIVVNKPKGLLVHGDVNEKSITLQNKVLAYLFSKGEYNLNDNFIPSPVHRLDRNTSGIVIFAKNFIFSQKLMDLFKTKEKISKYYIALVKGIVDKEGKIDAPILKDEENGKVSISSLKNGAKNALTLYKRIDFNDKYSLVDINLITGRTHQIRIHFSYIKHPLIGDRKYGDFQVNKIFEDKFNYSSQFLHAYKFKFLQLDDELAYLSNKEFVAPLPKKEKEILSLVCLTF